MSKVTRDASAQPASPFSGGDSVASVPPVAASRPHSVESPNGIRTDPYYWLRDDSRSVPEVIAHLEAENAYTKRMLAPVQPLIDELFDEIVARVKPDDASVPSRYRGYWYASRYVPGREYPIFVRWPADPTGAPPSGAAPDASPGAPLEEILLDCNQLAAGQPFFQLGAYEVSPDNRLLAYTVDTVGRRQYQLVVKDLATGALLADRIDNIESSIAWADDNSTLLYVEQDPVTLLGLRIRSHTLGAAPGTDALIYEETDDSFDLSVDRSKSEDFIFIGVESTTTSEWHYARAGTAQPRFQVFLPREAGHEYQIEHFEDRFLIRTNWDAENFRVMGVRIGEEGDRTRWVPLVEHSTTVFIHDFDVFRDFLAISERSDGLRKLRVRRWDGESWHLTAADPAYTMYLGSNPEMDVTQLRYTYTSLTTPTTTYDYDIRHHTHTLRKREPVLGAFDPADYVSEFVWAPARDGKKIPVSIVRHRKVAQDGKAPLMQYAYGSYGICIDPQFSSARLSLLNRGFVYAVAHVRGGQELGRHWYDDGRLLNKWHTFHDFIDVTDFLVNAAYCDPRRVFASGGSAGGLLMGVVMNQAPEKYAGIVANVPFVDVVTTMLDESIPLTTLEYDEWGNPNEPRYYDYMLSYSPYDNVGRHRYPPLLATTGLWDSQVQYYEPVKWVAKLRAAMSMGGSASGGEALLLHINMEAGHGGKSGRYEHLREIAREYGFIIGLSERPLADDAG